MKSYFYLLATLFFVATLWKTGVIECQVDGDGIDEPLPEEYQDSFGDEVDSIQKQVKETIKYVKPTIDGLFNFLETFESDVIGTKWIKSKAKKDGVDDQISKYDGEWAIESSLVSFLEGDLGLVLKSKAKHHAISSQLVKPFDFTKGKPLIIQYEVKFQNPLECGGAYVKLIANEPDFKLENFFDKTSFSIMFGPDKCGPDNKFHFIIRFKNPKTGVYEEKHAKRSELPDALFSDGRTHLFALIIRPDNTYAMFIDQNEVNKGSLLTDLTPPINPPKEIVDPNDSKPESWDDREKIPDPDAVKPDDWDESEPKTLPDPNASMPAGWLEEEPPMIPDPTAIKPDDWDSETDGEWEAPQIDNPKCQSAAGCGKWSAPSIDNPKYKGIWRAPLIENTNYQGKWEPRKIPNPEFFEDTDPFKSLTPFASVGLELWSMTDQIYFDNFLITDDESVAQQLATSTWTIKRDLELSNTKSADNVLTNLINATNEKPWLWAVYVLVILIPIVLIVVFCCGKSDKSKNSEQDEAASRKKTDAPSKDDAEGTEETNEPGEDNENEQEPEQVSEAASTVTKGDLESKEEDEDTATATTAAKSSSPTKRRTRKD